MKRGGAKKIHPYAINKLIVYGEGSKNVPIFLFTCFAKKEEDGNRMTLSCCALSLKTIN